MWGIRFDRVSKNLGPFPNNSSVRVFLLTSLNDLHCSIELLVKGFRSASLVVLFQIEQIQAHSIRGFKVRKSHPNSVLGYNLAHTAPFESERYVSPAASPSRPVGVGGVGRCAPHF